MKKKKILVLGGSGLLGSYLCEHYSKDYFIISTKLKKKIQKHIKIDATSFKDLSNLIKYHKPNIIINCIALTDVDKNEINKDIAIKLNIKIVNNLVVILKKFRDIHLIQISTDQVYHNKKIKFKNLERDVNPINYYGLTKFIGEIEALKHKKATVIRTNFFGNSNSSKKSYTDFIIQNLKKKIKTKVAKNIHFSPISMSYLSILINEIILHKVYGIYNIGSKELISKYNFVKKIAKIKNLSFKNILPFNSDVKKNKRPQGMAMSIKKIQSIVKFKIPSLDKMLEETLNEKQL